MPSAGADDCPAGLPALCPLDGPLKGAAADGCAEAGAVATVLTPPAGAPCLVTGMVGIPQPESSRATEPLSAATRTPRRPRLIACSWRERTIGFRTVTAIIQLAPPQITLEVNLANVSHHTQCEFPTRARRGSPDPAALGAGLPTPPELPTEGLLGGAMGLTLRK
jgi:hypothetical protein